MQRIKPFATRLPGAIAIGMVLFKILAGTLAYSQATPSAEPGTGHVVPTASHGRTVYLTQDQVDLMSPFHWSSVVFLVSFVAAVPLAVASRRNKSKE
jgi:hypothetical protein